ncbi:glycosyltransferase [Roseimaritima ulvae]|uniref:glycosyltransferase n=1 Tax=Roseimaritima ulvae TaxID=980254 RepID=UPI0008328F3C|nr:glycosyltransferase [Roseimaritima ulvae]
MDVRSIRRPICDGCQHRKPRDRCGLLPEGRNYIEGAKGLPNPNAYCPDHEWAGPFVRGRVGFLSECYMPVGGTEVWHQTLLPRLRDVVGFVSFNGAMTRGDLAKLPCTTGIGLEAARQLAWCVDVLVVWGLGSQLSEILTRATPKVVVVNHFDDRADWNNRLLQEAEPHADRFVHLCKSGRNVCGTDACYIPNAPAPERIQADQPRHLIRQELGVLPEQRMLVSISRLAPEKRLDVLIRAANQLPANYRFVLAGTGNDSAYEGYLRGLAGNRVQFVGSVEHPGRLLRAADSFVSASACEGYGLSAAEAMLAGVPVVSTPVGLLEDSPELARLVPINGTATDWVTAIHTDFANPQAQRRRANIAQRKIDRVQAFAESWQHLIDEVAR